MVISRGRPFCITVKILSATMSNAEACICFTTLGRPFGLPLFPFGNWPMLDHLFELFISSRGRLLGQKRLFTGHGAPSRECDIDIGWIQLHSAETTAGAFSRN